MLKFQQLILNLLEDEQEFMNEVILINFSRPKKFEMIENIYENSELLKI